MPEPQSLRRWDVICRVVDHYGDAGVCLRLARGLAAVPGREVRLLVDQPEVVLDLIRPRPMQTQPRPEQIQPASESSATDAPEGESVGRPDRSRSAAGHGHGLTWLDRSGVRICGWDAPLREVDVVLETFGSDIPAALLEDMRARQAAGQGAPVWLNLEHLSAEAWVEGCHGLPSPQAGGSTRWFLFPGFTHSTAGLLGPQAVLPELPSEFAAWLGRADVPGRSCNGLHPGQRDIIGSAFCYRDSPLPALLDAMQRGPVPVRLAIPVGMPGDLGGRVLGEEPGSTWRDGQLTLVRIPFVDQDLYDSVLAACDFNIVRGEDSFVRAQWAARPMLWAAYREPGATHLDKVAAWLERCEMPPEWASLHGWFNGGFTDSDLSPSRLWNEAVSGLVAADTWATAWREHLLTLPRLTDTLADFALKQAQRIQ